MTGTTLNLFGNDGDLTLPPGEQPPKKGDRGAASRAEAWAASKAFEKRVKEQNDVYADRGLGYIQKYHVPQMMAGGRLIWLKKTGFDFCGGARMPKYDEFGNKTTILMPVFIECKSSKDGFIATFQETQGIKAHQIEIMAQTASMGFYTRFLWEVRSNRVTFLLSPEKLFEICGRNGEIKKSLTLEDCIAFKVPRVTVTKERGWEYFDYLGIMENE